MPIQTDPSPILDHGYIVRVQPPSIPGGRRVLLMLHGWTGNENVMWIFTRGLPQDYWIFAPRGPVQSPTGGYGWTASESGSFQQYSSFSAVAPDLSATVDGWLKDRKIEAAQINLMGFSQGAAMVYALLIESPTHFNKTAALSGFLPEGAKASLQTNSLTGKEIFIAHGNRDETVPVALARRSAEQLEAAGAKVTYCEDDTGHKLGASCHRGLQTFFA